MSILTDTDDLRLSIPFKSRYAGPLAQSFGLDLDHPNQLVDDQYQVHPVSLEFEAAQGTDWLLTANYPNPFRQVTTFELNLPKESLVTLEVYSPAGQRLLQQSSTLGGGFNQLMVRAKDLSQDGILWYRISVDGESRSGKMILIK
ncbi:MAG: T9SS type A sorting domain-containing protein [Cyanothece sp. SIO1E1]|nr:T9SS type A sorting domain-containing protein [Cyanothece sp. SIO1E1]